MTKETRKVKSVSFCVVECLDVFYTPKPSFKTNKIIKITYLKDLLYENEVELEITTLFPNYLIADLDYEYLSIENDYAEFIKQELKKEIDIDHQRSSFKQELDMITKMRGQNE